LHSSVLRLREFELIAAGSSFEDYTAHFADPDIHLDWCDILQVILPTSSSALSAVSTSGIDQAVDGESARKGGAIPTCPICLSEPTAARMVSSLSPGHVRENIR